VHLRHDRGQKGPGRRPEWGASAVLSVR
jgi:hypothetical protein